MSRTRTAFFLWLGVGLTIAGVAKFASRNSLKKDLTAQQLKHVETLLRSAQGTLENIDPGSVNTSELTLQIAKAQEQLAHLNIK